LAALERQYLALSAPAESVGDGRGALKILGEMFPYCLELRALEEALARGSVDEATPRGKVARFPADNLARDLGTSSAFANSHLGGRTCLPILKGPSQHTMSLKPQGPQGEAESERDNVCWPIEEPSPVVVVVPKGNDNASGWHDRRAHLGQSRVGYGCFSDQVLVVLSSSRTR
jgi:hypothetical protein